MSILDASALTFAEVWETYIEPNLEKPPTEMTVDERIAEIQGMALSMSMVTGQRVDMQAIEKQVRETWPPKPGDKERDRAILIEKIRELTRRAKDRPAGNPNVKKIKQAAAAITLKRKDSKA